MKMLQIAHELTLPLETAATQTYAFLGRKGSGKTYAAGRLVELLLDAGVQVLVLDNVGNWGSGLRLSADGKGKGFDVPVLGGLRGDVPLEENAGKLVADTLADTRRSAVLDMSQFSLSARRRFATAFGEQMWLRKKGEHDPSPLLLVIVPKELARVHLPVGRYSRMRASTCLRNWLAFLTLRMEKSAQWEIRQYANSVGSLINDNFPRTWELFEEGLAS